MSEEIRITVLVENSVQRRGLAAEHGLSFHVQAGSRSLIFDTGQSDLVRRNAEALGMPFTLNAMKVSWCCWAVRTPAW